MTEVAALPPKTHNNPPEAVEPPTPLQALLAKLAEAKALQTETPKIKTEAEAAKVKAMVDDLRKVFKAAEDKRKLDNKPHDEAIDANNSLYRQPVKDVESIGKALGALGAVYLREKQAELDRLAEIARVEAARLKKEQEDAARTAQAALDKGDVVAAEAALVAEAEAKTAGAAAEKTGRGEKAKIAGGGRAMALRETWSAKITDPAKAAEHYKNYDAVKTAINLAVEILARTDAQAFKDKDLAPPGVEFIVSNGAV